MHPMTAGNLRSAFGGECMAHMRYNHWASVARREDLPEIAQLFRAIAAAEQVHATNHFRQLGEEAGDFLVPSMAVFGLGRTPQNLQGGIDGETYEITEMYPAFLQVAESQGEAGAVRSFMWALSAEKTHAVFFQRARKSAEAGQDLNLGPVQVCTVCGYTVEGDAPDPCPICDAARDKFKTFDWRPGLEDRPEAGRGNRA